MSEEAYNYIHGDDVGRFTVTTKTGRDALVRRCEKYDADFKVDDYCPDGEWDSAVITVDSSDLRPVRMLIQP